MIKHVTVGTDGSRYAEGAARYAVWLADAYQTKLTGCYVMDRRVLEGPFFARLSMLLGFTPATDYREAVEPVLHSLGETALGFIAELAREAGVEFTPRICEGPVASTLVERAAKSEVLVVGRQGDHAAYENDLLGSVAEAVLRRAPAAVLLAPADYLEPQRLALFYDQHTVDGETLRFTLALPRELPLLVIHTPALADEARRTLEEYGRPAEFEALAETPAERVARLDDSDLTLFEADNERDHLVIDARVQQVINNSRGPLLIA